MQQRIGELKERDARLPARADGLLPRHFWHGEQRADFAEEVDEMEIPQPVGVVDEQRLSVGEIQKLGELLLDALAVMVELVSNTPSGRAAAEPKISVIASKPDKNLFLKMNSPFYKINKCIIQYHNKKVNIF